MYKEILRSIAGIEVFPVISLCLFVVVFAVVLVWTSRLDGAWLARSAGLPLEPAPPSPAGDGRHAEGGGQ
jgi:cytochrome c oxidase cbb3-type subunit IV